MNRILGPPSYENWTSALLEMNVIDGFEVPLFTDAHITGNIQDGFGPYKFLNPIAIPTSSDTIIPGVFLRVENYLELPSLERDDKRNMGNNHYILK